MKATKNAPMPEISHRQPLFDLSNRVLPNSINLKKFNPGCLVALEKNICRNTHFFVPMNKSGQHKLVAPSFLEVAIKASPLPIPKHIVFSGGVTRRSLDGELLPDYEDIDAIIPEQERIQNHLEHLNTEFVTWTQKLPKIKSDGLDCMRNTSEFGQIRISSGNLSSDDAWVQARLISNINPFDLTFRSTNYPTENMRDYFAAHETKINVPLLSASNRTEPDLSKAEIIGCELDPWTAETLRKEKILYSIYSEKHYTHEGGSPHQLNPQMLSKLTQYILKEWAVQTSFREDILSVVYDQAKSEGSNEDVAKRICHKFKVNFNTKQYKDIQLKAFAQALLMFKLIPNTADNDIETQLISAFTGQGLILLHNSEEHESNPQFFETWYNWVGDQTTSKSQVSEILRSIVNYPNLLSDNLKLDTRDICYIDSQGDQQLSTQHFLMFEGTVLFHFDQIDLNAGEITEDKSIQEILSSHPEMGAVLFDKAKTDRLFKLERDNPPSNTLKNLNNKINLKEKLNSKKHVIDRLLHLQRNSSLSLDSQEIQNLDDTFKKLESKLKTLRDFDYDHAIDTLKKYCNATLAEKAKYVDALTGDENLLGNLQKFFNGHNSLHEEIVIFFKELDEVTEKTNQRVSSKLKDVDKIALSLVNKNNKGYKSTLTGHERNPAHLEALLDSKQQDIDRLWALRKNTLVFPNHEIVSTLKNEYGTLNAELAELKSFNDNCNLLTKYCETPLAKKEESLDALPETEKFLTTLAELVEKYDSLENKIKKYIDSLSEVKGKTNKKIFTSVSESIKNTEKLLETFETQIQKSNQVISTLEHTMPHRNTESSFNLLVKNISSILPASSSSTVENLKAVRDEKIALRKSIDKAKKYFIEDIDLCDSLSKKLKHDLRELEELKNTSNPKHLDVLKNHSTLMYEIKVDLKTLKIPEVEEIKANAQKRTLYISKALESKKSVENSYSALTARFKKLSEAVAQRASPPKEPLGVAIGKINIQKLIATQIINLLDDKKSSFSSAMNGFIKLLNTMESSEFRTSTSMYDEMHKLYSDLDGYFSIMINQSRDCVLIDDLEVLKFNSTVSSVKSAIDMFEGYVKGLILNLVENVDPETKKEFSTSLESCTNSFKSNIESLTQLSNSLTFGLGLGVLKKNEPIVLNYLNKISHGAYNNDRKTFYNFLAGAFKIKALNISAEIRNEAIKKYLGDSNIAKLNSAESIVWRAEHEQIKKCLLELPYISEAYAPYRAYLKDFILEGEADKERGVYFSYSIGYLTEWIANDMGRIMAPGESYRNFNLNLFLSIYNAQNATDLDMNAFIELVNRNKIDTYNLVVLRQALDLIV